MDRLSLLFAKYKVIAAFVAVAVLCFGSYRVGVKLERVGWQEKENARLAATAKLALKAAENNERERQENEAKARKVTQEHEDEKAAIRAEFDRKSDRLRINRAVCNPAPAPSETASPSGSNGTASASVALPEDIERHLRGLAKQADEMTAIARGLQKWVRENGFYGSGNGNAKEESR